jgi:exopolysaccharide production protein ExoZ
MAKSSEQIHSLQALRAIAACAVVYFHSRTRVQLILGAQSGVADSIADLGTAGVDLFFVLSGFLMTNLHKEQFGTGASLRFLSHRIIRIVPLYWLLSGLGMAVLLIAPQLFSSIREISIPWILGNFLFVPWPQRSGTMEHVLIVGWTLDYEMYFYVLFALAMMSRRGLPLLSAALLLSVAAGFLLKPIHPWLQLLTDGMLLEFLAGIGVAMLFARLPASAVRGWTALIVGIVLFATSTAFRAPRYLKWGVPCALILLGCLWVGFQCRGIIGRVLTLVGDASYSIYLFQVFALPATALLFRAARLGAMPADLLILALCCAGCGAGVLCWRFIERPITKWIKRHLDSRSRVAA